MLKCYTRSMSDELYNMMLSLCPGDWEFIRVKNSSALGYLEYIVSDINQSDNSSQANKWILNLDEDCFLINYKQIYSLIEFLEKNNFDYTGIQDGGVIPVRIHNPLVVNPFFNLFNAEKLNLIKSNYKRNVYDVEEIKNKYQHYVKYQKTELKYDCYEPFYNFFFWLLESGLVPFFHNAEQYDKEKYLVIAPVLRIIPYYNSPSIIFDHLNNEIGVHTWHSRYINYPNIKKRIKNCYQLAKSRSSLKNENKNVKVVNLGK